MIVSFQATLSYTSEFPEKCVFVRKSRACSEIFLFSGLQLQRRFRRTATVNFFLKMRGPKMFLFFFFCQVTLNVNVTSSYMKLARTIQNNFKHSPKIGRRKEQLLASEWNGKILF